MRGDVEEGAGGNKDGDGSFFPVIKLVSTDKSLPDDDDDGAGLSIVSIRINFLFIFSTSSFVGTFPTIGKLDVVGVIIIFFLSLF